VSQPAPPAYETEHEVVIGLEVHCHLRTRSKLFSSAAVSYGDAPNQHVTEVCLALPGALPVLNGRAVELAIRAGLALNCKVHPTSVFARKNYFYPDLPKGYQISQFEEPLCTEGFLDIDVAGGTRRIGITRIHMEEDAGKSIHDGAATTLVDLNRSGVPLVEIVSEPDLRSAEEVGVYLRTLRQILRYVGASDADMEKGQLRCDANVSLRRPGEDRLGTRREIKNLNSFRNAEAAVRTEIENQAERLGAGGRVVQATVGYEADAGRIFVMRTKENADDYRYFPDPDLIPLTVPESRIDEIRKALPELPGVRCRRFVETLGLKDEDARVLTASRELADWFEAAAAAHGSAQTVASWTRRDVLGALNDRDVEIDAVALAPAAFAALVKMTDEGRVTPRNARDLLGEILFEGGDPEALVRERGLEAVSDAGELEALVDAAIATNPRAVASYASGDKKSLNFLMGQVMKQTQGKADPGSVREILARKLGG